MRKVFIFFLAVSSLLLFYNSIANSDNLKKNNMDGITLLTGVYMPFHNATKGIYGNSLVTGIQHSLNMGRSIDIMSSISFTRDRGNPYYDVSTFSSDNSSVIRFIPIEVSVRRRIGLVKDSSGFASRGIYSGIGINYIIAREEIPDILIAKGGDFGLQIFAGPQVFFKDRFVFEGEVKFIMNNVNMKYQKESYVQDKDYMLNLYGIVIKLALSWYY